MNDDRLEAAAKAIWFAGRDGQEWALGDPLCDMVVDEARAALLAADAVSSGRPGVKQEKRAARLVRELLKNLDSWESQGHTTVTIKHLRRHFSRDT